METKDEQKVLPWQKQDAERLKAIYDARIKISQAKFGADYDLGSQGMVWQYLNAHAPLNIDAAMKFARGLDVDVAEFSPRLAAKLKRIAAHESNVEGGAVIVALPSEVPVVGTAQLGTDGFWEAIDYPVGYGDGFVRYPTKDKNAYALRVKGDSMRPRIKPGEFVLIEPNTRCDPGHEVMVQTKNGRCMVKVLDFRRNGVVQLSSVNETDFKPFTLDESEIEKIHRMAAIIPSDLYYRDNV